MAVFDWLIVGLGNPGEKYAPTRHNIGWLVAQALVAKHLSEFRAGKGDWYEAPIAVGRHKALVILPTTYMNLSGTAAAKAARQINLPAERVIAIVDEYNFPVGRVHLKNSGSDGGHNGTASMIQEFRTEKFLRLRCGIDKKFGAGELVDYVLKPFADDEIIVRDEMILRGITAIEGVMRLGTARAMQLINSEALFKPSEDKPEG